MHRNILKETGTETEKIIYYHSQRFFDSSTEPDSKKHSVEPTSINNFKGLSINCMYCLIVKIIEYRRLIQGYEIESRLGILNVNDFYFCFESKCLKFIYFEKTIKFCEIFLF